ncbi:MAG: hypothetical protein JWO38_6858 [Gemmataceae bacterium]|nr:hypothetical protein [Gemmataceae bacterium]
MARLSLNDGYTLDAATLPEFGGARGFPVVTYRYRPALPDALAEWRYASRMAGSGKAEVDATAKLVAGHLVSWDVEVAPGTTAPITPETVRKVPEPILNQILERVVSWAGPEQEKAAGNS